MQGEQRIDRIEQASGDAKSAARKATSLAPDLRQAILDLHQKASALRHTPASPDSLRREGIQLEEFADQAMQALRQAGPGLDPQLQQTVQRAHAEASGRKKELLQSA